MIPNIPIFPDASDVQRIHDRRPPRLGLKTNETEAQFQHAVLHLAALRGWTAWHDYDSRRNARGLPDLILVRAPRVLFVELKRAGGRLRGEQRAWLRELRACPGVETFVFYPCDFAEIERVLV